jgi:hypothetical protein
MDMEEYFDYTQEKLKKIIKEVKRIGVSEYHPTTKKAKKKAIKALKKLHKEFEF